MASPHKQGSMRAMVLRGLGQPLTLENVAIPVAGPTDVLVRVCACGVGLTVVNLIATPDALHRTRASRVMR
jgi:D-arabinose 1-dehydrogenase-like Zn-dependent alcohol dehydrogenase